MWSPHDLIVAAATVPGAGARAIVRVAGVGLPDILGRLFTPEGGRFALPGERPRVVRARLAMDGPLGGWGSLPVEILHWPGPGGPTGGPLAEIQVPASAALVDAAVAAACVLGARLACGGEFSFRGFLAGRLDLLQAEAVLAVAEARTPAELSAALDRLAGGVGRQLDAVRETLLDLAADVEATIDFADEHTPVSLTAADAAAWRRVETGLEAVGETLAGIAGRLEARDPGSGAELPRVVLAGPPNVGKSSLYNAVVGREAALVADESGTTRDWLETRVDFPGGASCMLVDVAGLGEAGGRIAVEQDAVERARAEIARADVVLVCHDAAATSVAPEPPAAAAAPPRPTAVRIDVLTRCDLRPRAPVAGIIRTSSRSGEGLAELRNAIGHAIVGLPRRGTTATLRMRVGVAAAHDAVTAAREEAASRGQNRDEAVVAGLVREAVAAIDEVTGRQIGTDLVDRIFSRHCIGK